MNTPDCELSCGCWKRIRLDLAREGETETCNLHGIGVTIVIVNRYEWHVHCQEYGCRFGRWMGQSEPLARKVNGNHATKHNHLGGVQYDRITWDGRGSIYRGRGLRANDRNPKPPPSNLRYQNVIRKDEDWTAPPF